MRGDVDIAAAAALLAEPARATLVLAVLDDGPLSASELAARARIAPSTASEHLARLVAGGFLLAHKSGRYRQYSLASAAVADAVEALAVVAPQSQPRSLRDATRGELIREARTCYDHLAGRLGVTVARALERDRALVRRGGTYALGPRATRVFGALGIDVRALERERRGLVRGCLDWSERELHLGGAVGAAVARRLFDLGWIERRDTTRAVAVTTDGAKLLRRRLGVEAEPARKRAARSRRGSAV